MVSRGLGSAVAHGDRVTHMLVELGQGGRPEDHLVRPLEAVPREEWRLHRGARVGAEDGHRPAVELQRVEVHPGEPGHVRVVAEQAVRLALGEVLVAGEARQQHGVPVPSVERRTRDERVEAGAEREGGGHHGDGQHGTEDGRAHGNGVAPAHRAPGRSGPRPPPAPAGPTRPSPGPRPTSVRRSPGCGPPPGGARPGRPGTTERAPRTTMSTRTPNRAPSSRTPLRASGTPAAPGRWGRAGRARPPPPRPGASPRTTEPRMPISPSSTVVAGPAPRARSTPSSSAPERSWRPITCRAMRARPVRRSPRRRRGRWPRAVWIARPWPRRVPGPPLPSSPPAAVRRFPGDAVDLGLSRRASPGAPPSACRALPEYVAQHCAICRVSAGVKSATC